mmetsp:Transcript_27430/g.72045  ORF Transcript_27430/g.72045 Transcript_27430/m.72045 type:complete len:230 (+) Transcript_27430:183-872(+)
MQRGGCLGLQPEESRLCGLQLDRDPRDKVANIGTSHRVAHLDRRVRGQPKLVEPQRDIRGGTPAIEQEGRGGARGQRLAPHGTAAAGRKRRHHGHALARRSVLVDGNHLGLLQDLEQSVVQRVDPGAHDQRGPGDRVPRKVGLRLGDINPRQVVPNLETVGVRPWAVPDARCPHRPVVVHRSPDLLADEAPAVAHVEARPEAVEAAEGGVLCDPLQPTIPPAVALPRVR